MGKVSQKDIADSLKISRVTVTKALQEHPAIAKDTIRKVKEKALEMKYIPDFIGRSLASSRTHTIGIVLPKIAHSFFSYSIEKMYEAAREKGYNIIPMVSFEDQEKELDNIKTLLSMRVDGIILDPAQNSAGNPGFDLAREAGCKVIYFDRCPNDFEGAAIVTDDYHGANKLTKLLIDKAYRKICLFTGPDYLSVSVNRRIGYEDAMKEGKKKPRIVNVDMTKESGYQAFSQLANSNDLPDAIFAVNDSVALGVYDAAHEHGFSIPQDIAVAGFGDIDASAMLQPTMTSVRPPLDLMAESAINSIINMIEKDIDDGTIQVFESQIIERNST